MNTRSEDPNESTTPSAADGASAAAGPDNGEPGSPAAPEAGDTAEERAGAAEPAGAEPDDDSGDDPEGERYADSGWPAAAPRTAGVFSAETFAIAAVLLVGASLIGTRLAEMWASVRSADQLSALTAIILGDGGTALLGAVLGALGLVLANADTRPWARWAAMAAIVVGLLFVVLSVTTYLMVPPPAPPSPLGM
ncbi:hypothetical protein ACFO4E_02770 [Nocardiopsis mangrovi]|uniref:Uncharacterized protein n=1 Tax=Nocardiopsis mangrovi TaxID=1179818 RepID=A0ABV9DS27_9ACTN